MAGLSKFFSKTKTRSLAASRSGSKVGKDPTRRAAAIKREKRMARKKFGRDMMKGAMRRMGLNVKGIAGNAKSPIGRLLQSPAMRAMSMGKFDVTLPSRDNAARASNVNKPSISTLTGQLSSIAETAARLGAITQEQQATLISQARSAETISAQTQMEEPDATPIKTEGPGAGIDPGVSATEKLLESIARLKAIIDDKVREQQQNSFGNVFVESLLDNMGLGGVKEARANRRKRPRVKDGVMSREGKTGTEFYKHDERGRIKAVKAEDALANFKTVEKTDSFKLNDAAEARQAEAVLGKGSTRAVRQAEAVAGKGTTFSGSSSTDKIANTIGRGAKKAGGATPTGAGKVSKAAIEKVAGPLVSKAIGKTALKSIPLVGAAAGGLFAIGKLLQGDVVGAGLEAASGLGGPLTAIPAMVASLSRDTYMGVFGVAPESDPYFGMKMGLVTSVLTALVTTAFAKMIGSGKEAPVAKDATKVPEIPTEAPKIAPVATKEAAPTPSALSEGGGGGGGDAGSQAQAAAGGGGGAAGSQAAAGGAAATPAPSPEPAGAGGAATGAMQSPVEQAPISGLSPGTPKPVEQPGTQSGAAIAAASGDASAPEAMQAGGGQSMPRPSNTPTTKGRAKGMGNVPEPTYLGMGDIVKQLYFGAVAGAMAA
jgi:hypothetical protein